MQKALIAAVMAVTAVAVLPAVASAEDPRAGHCGVDRYWEPGAQACLDARNAPGNRAVVVEEKAPVVVKERDTATGATETFVVKEVDVKRY